MLLKSFGFIEDNPRFNRGGGDFVTGAGAWAVSFDPLLLFSSTDAFVGLEGEAGESAPFGEAKPAGDSAPLGEDGPIGVDIE